MSFKANEKWSEEETFSSSSSPNLRQYFEMLTYKRYEGSQSLEDFCGKYLLPVMGKPDVHGNYMLVINEKDGSLPRIAFMAHSDSVHWSGGRQVVEWSNPWAQLPKDSLSDCLGADCATGVWLILHMIKNKIPGRYIIHAEEESGMIGAKALIKDQLDSMCEEYWLDQVDFAISFDRKGFDSIITHQCGYRTASETFSRSLNEALGGGFVSDDGGSYTDSEAYSEYISECTNLSVGYFNQHSRNEVQHIPFLESLARKLVAADWSKLKAERDCNAYNYAPYSYSNSSSFKSRFDHSMDAAANKPAPISVVETKNVVSVEEYNDTGWVDYTTDELEKNNAKYVAMESLCRDHPSKLADMLIAYGFDIDDLRRELGLHEIIRGVDDRDW